MPFNPLCLKNIKLKNRFVRSATYEGMSDKYGFPNPELGLLYEELISNDIAMIITGFCYISKTGRSMQPYQCGIDNDNKISAWKDLLSKARQNTSTPIIMQLAHSGRQTIESITQQNVISSTKKRSSYFKSKPKIMSEKDIQKVIKEFGDAALRAKKAGFDGIQLHAAHGYLIHQFVSSKINNRKDKWGKDKFLFLYEIIKDVRTKCGSYYPIFLKISAEDEWLSYQLNNLDIEAIEISYGTMDEAFNIFRGSLPLKRILEYNPFIAKQSKLKKILWEKLFFPIIKLKQIPFSENYNRYFAKKLKKFIKIPIILVGGIRSIDSIQDIIQSKDANAVSLCRPLICEPNLIKKFKNNLSIKSKCSNCNCCAIMCDSNNQLKCYRR